MLGKRVCISQQPTLFSKTLFLFYEAELSSGSVGGTSFAVLGDHANHEALSLASAAVSNKGFCMLDLASALAGKEEENFHSGSAETVP